MANSTNPEQAWKEALENLQEKMKRYAEVAKKDNKKATKNAIDSVVDAMQKVGDSHCDPPVREHWYAKAEAFGKGNDEEREGMLTDIGKGLLILLATPFLLVGGVLFAAGAIIYGVGSVVKGLGNLVTGGVFQDRKPRAKPSSSQPPPYSRN